MSNMDVETSVISEISTTDFIKLLETSESTRVFLLKFGAPWCGPCEKIKPLCNTYFTKIQQSYPNITCIDIDVDETMDLYIVLKKKKMISGLPTILAYYGGSREHWFIPDDSVSGGDTQQVGDFFERVIKYSNNLDGIIDMISQNKI